MTPSAPVPDAMPLSDAAAPVRQGKTSDIASRLLEAVTHAAERNGMSVSASARGNTMDLLTTLPAELPLPAVVVESEDEIGLDWDEGTESVVSLTVDDSDRIGFAALFGREPLYGHVEFSDGLPETVRYLLARLYPSTRPRWGTGHRARFALPCDAGRKTGAPGRRVMRRREGVQNSCARSVALSGRVSRSRAMPTRGRRSVAGGAFWGQGSLSGLRVRPGDGWQEAARCVELPI